MWPFKTKGPDHYLHRLTWEQLTDEVILSPKGRPDVQIEATRRLVQSTTRQANVMIRLTWVILICTVALVLVALWDPIKDFGTKI